ncbi:NUDIX domain-containing protein [Streptomyces sp. NPDC054901]
MTSFRLAAYAVCIEDGRVLPARHLPPNGEPDWTPPGGRVEHAEDPVGTVIREVAEETGCDAVVERLPGVDSRVIPAAERAVRCGPEHHDVGSRHRPRARHGARSGSRSPGPGAVLRCGCPEPALVTTGSARGDEMCAVHGDLSRC